MALASSNAKAGTVSAQVVAAIAAVELPNNQWPDLIEILLGFVNNDANTNLKISTLQTIGFICETIVRSLTRLSGFSLSNLSFRNLRFSVFEQMKSSLQSFTAPVRKNHLMKSSLLLSTLYSILWSSLERTSSAR